MTNLEQLATELYERLRSDNFTDSEIIDMIVNKPTLGFEDLEEILYDICVNNLGQVINSISIC